MKKLSLILFNWRMIVLILFLIFSYIIINPQFDSSGVVIKSIDQNSVASDAGFQNPTLSTPQTQLEKIISINAKKINNLEDYSNEISSITNNQSIRIVTSKNKEYIFQKTSDDLGLNVEKAFSSNIKKGLELQGGTRVILKPAEKITEQQRDDVIAVMQNRLNTFGVLDIKIKKADDLLGNKFISVEVAGATKQEVKDLIASQGKFEAKIGNLTVFEGGKKDIPFVCRNDGTCSGVTECSQQSTGDYACKFQFAITLSPEAAKKHAEITSKLDIIPGTAGSSYLSQPLDLYLDDVQVDSLQISSDLKGSEVTQISIQGPGVGLDEQEALQTAIKNMNKLQTVLITGSLPSKLDVVKFDTISPSLGSSFVKNAILAGLAAMLAVGIVIFLRYRSFKIAIPMIFTMLSELFIVLGFATLIKFNLDLAAIAGIIASIGTGVNDQIVIADEVLAKGKEFEFRTKQKIKRAFFIIFAAFSAIVVAMIPLFFAGTGLLTGFALTTIAGITIGVLITRPAYGMFLEKTMD